MYWSVVIDCRLWYQKCFSSRINLHMLHECTVLSSLSCKKVKFSHTRYRALGLELIPVYRQSARRWREVNHAIDLNQMCAAVTFCQACSYIRSFHQMALPVNGSTHLIPAYYSFIDPERMKGWVGLVGWPVADGLPTLVVTHQLQVERRTGKVRQSETDVLPLCHATASHLWFW